MLENVSTRTKVIAVVAIVVLSYATGRYFQPAKVVTKIEEHTVEVDVSDHDKKQTVIEITRPDGTKEKQTITEDNTHNEKRKEDDKKSEKIVENEKAQWHIGAGLALKPGPLGPVYSATVERRILGPIFAGAFANTDKVVGLSVSLEF